MSIAYEFISSDFSILEGRIQQYFFELVKMVSTLTVSYSKSQRDSQQNENLLNFFNLFQSHFLGPFFRTILNFLSVENIFLVSDEHICDYVMQITFFIQDMSEIPEELIHLLFRLMIASSYVSLEEYESESVNGLSFYSEVFQAPIQERKDNLKCVSVPKNLPFLSSWIIDTLQKKGFGFAILDFFSQLVSSGTSRFYNVVLRLLSVLLHSVPSFLEPLDWLRFDETFHPLYHSNNPVDQISYLLFRIELLRNFQIEDEQITAYITSLLQVENDVLFNVVLDYIGCLIYHKRQISDMTLNYFFEKSNKANNLALLSLFHASCSSPNFDIYFQKVYDFWFHSLSHEPTSKDPRKYTGDFSSFAHGIASCIAYFISVHGTNLDFTCVLDFFENFNDIEMEFFNGDSPSNVLFSFPIIFDAILKVKEFPLRISIGALVKFFTSASTALDDQFEFTLLLITAFFLRQQEFVEEEIYLLILDSIVDLLNTNELFYEPYFILLAFFAQANLLTMENLENLIPFLFNMKLDISDPRISTGLFISMLILSGYEPDDQLIERLIMRIQLETPDFHQKEKPFLIQAVQAIPSIHPDLKNQLIEFIQKEPCVQDDEMDNFLQFIQI